MKRAIATSLIAAIAIALPCGAPAQTAPEPSASPAASALPEIGRVRATSAACAAMRDLVIPGFAAARRADMRFDAVRQDLPRYIELKAAYTSQQDTVKSGGVNLQSQLSKLSSESASLLQEAQTIRKLLDDPRLSAQSSDPSIRAERERLEALYAAQQARASYLNELVQRESVMLAKSNAGMEDPLGMPQGQHLPIEPQARPRPASTALPGMPVLNGFEAADRKRLEEWSAAQARAVHETEEQAAKTFLPLAQGCR